MSTLTELLACAQERMMADAEEDEAALAATLPAEAFCEGDTCRTDFASDMRYGLAVRPTAARVTCAHCGCLL
jgi:hypothetical protein